MRAKIKGKGAVVIVVGGGERRESGRKKKNYGDFFLSEDSSYGVHGPGQRSPHPKYR